MVNPFSPTFPINPRYFVNRAEILNSFKKALKRSVKTEMPTPDNMAILGDWGIGKTSVLRKFEDLTLKNFRQRKTFSAIVELGPTSCNSWIAFVQKVIDDVDRNFVSSSSIIARIRKEIRNWRIKTVGIGGSMVLERKIREKSEISIFRDALIELWNILNKSGVGIALLMLDDLHYLAEKYPDGLYDLRSIFQGLPRQGCNFMLCATGKKDLFVNIRELAEPLSRFFNIKHTLQPFNPEETTWAIRRPLELTGLNLSVDNKVIDEIHRLTAGHPFFIHFIMREVVSHKEKGKVTPNYFKKIYTEVEKIMAREKFEVDFSIASDKEKQILLAIARVDSDTLSPSALKIKNAKSQFRYLLKKNLLVKYERGEYALYHPLFKRYLLSLC